MTILTWKKFIPSIAQLVVVLTFIDSISKSHGTKGRCGARKKITLSSMQIRFMMMANKKDACGRYDECAWPRI
jgi:hypothetical protein